MGKPMGTDQERWDELLGRVTVDPLRCGGAPCVDGRVPASTILGGLGLGMTPEQIIQYFPSLVVDDILAVCAYASEMIDELAQLRADLAQAQAERDAATIEVNDLRMSGSLLANQMVCACGGGLSKLLGCLECGTRYELISSDQLKRITDKLRVYEIASENAPPFSASSFEAVSYAIAERDAATRRAEQAEAVLSEQADIITANLWHIPPEYAARNILLDVAMKMRAALNGPEGGPR